MVYTTAMKTLVIVGISGDLAKRKLLPALRALKTSGALPLERIIGTTRRGLDAASLLTPHDPLTELLELRRLEDVQGIKDGVFYLAVPPGTAPVTAAELAKNNKGILVLEKPFGTDSETAKMEAEQIAQVFAPDKIFRVGHYLAKPVGERLAAQASVAGATRIEVVASEIVGLEGRAAYYETSGALRDFNNHLLSLLTQTLGARGADERTEALRRLSVVRAARGQYNGYEEELGRGSSTETLAVLELVYEPMPDTTIVLATGKALAHKETCVQVKRAEGKEQTCELPTDADSYERIFKALFERDRQMFLDLPEIMESWRIVDEALALWQSTPLLRYERGSAIESIVEKLGFSVAL